MLLKELFDKPVKIDWDKSSDEWKGKFKIEDATYEIEFTKNDNIDKNAWVIYFTLFKHPKIEKWYSHDITNTGNEIKVFSLVRI